MSVTIVDIAKSVGVSHPVVSKVLNGGRGTSNASESTRQKILDAARQLGYRPHAASQALRKQEFRNVGILMGGDTEFYLPQKTMAALAQALSIQGYTSSLVCTEEFDAEHLLASPLLRDHTVDVLLIGYVYETPITVVEAVERLGVSTIWLNRSVASDAVYVDEADGAGQLVSHLASLGHQRITFVDYSGEGGQNPVVAERLKGMGIRGEELGVDISYVTHKRVPRGTRKPVAKAWLSRKNRANAVICNSLSSAQLMMQAAIELQIDVPGDLAITTFDNGIDHRITEPGITCAVRPDTLFGEEAAALALEKAKSPTKSVDSKRLQFTLDVCGSTVPGAR